MDSRTWYRACCNTNGSRLDWHASQLPDFQIMSHTAATAVKTFISRLPQFGNRIDKSSHKPKEKEQN